MEDFEKAAADRASERGRSIIEEMMGDDFLKQRDGRANDFNAVIQDYSDQVCFGRIWARGGLSRQQRSMINVAMLVALGRTAQLRTHFEGALNNGCSVSELQEVLLQSAVYCGLPAAVEGFKIAEEILKKRGEL